MRQLYLAAYLPHKLKIKYSDNIIVMNAGTGSSKNWIGITAVIQRSAKPILRPLSDLTKEIDHNGEKVVPIDWLWKNTDCTADIEFMEHVQAFSEKPHEINFQSGSYWIVQKLISWHFDVFGLIAKGEAVDINTI